MSQESLILEEFEQAALLLQRFMHDSIKVSLIAESALLMANTIKSGGKIISCGNGGSHCDAMHFAEEMTGRYRDERAALPAVAISDPAHISCVGNDYGFDQIFSRYIEAMGQNDDVLLAITTSGNSKNIIYAVDAAKKKNMKIIALTGNDGGVIADKVDLEIRVPYRGYADRIQEIHIKVIHVLIGQVEKLIMEL